MDLLRRGLMLKGLGHCQLEPQAAPRCIPSAHVQPKHLMKSESAVRTEHFHEDNALSSCFSNSPCPPLFISLLPFPQVIPAGTWVMVQLHLWPRSCSLCSPFPSYNVSYSPAPFLKCEWTTHLKKWWSDSDNIPYWKCWWRVGSDDELLLHLWWTHTGQPSLPFNSYISSEHWRLWDMSSWTIMSSHWCHKRKSADHQSHQD